MLGQGALNANGPNYKSNNNPSFGLDAPTAVTVDSWGNLWVSDTGNNRVVEWQPIYYSTFYNGQQMTNLLGISSWNAVRT